MNMEIYLIRDYARIDGVTGEFIEKEFASDFVKYDSRIELESGRNQYVSFQVVLDGKGAPVENLVVECSELLGPGTLSNNNYELFIEWFHKVNGKFVPDALIPFDSTRLKFRIPLDEKTLADQKAGVLWVDLFVPEGTQAGTYSGNVRVSTEHMEKVFRIDIKVYDVLVPHQSKMFADLNNYADSISPAFPALRSNRDRYEDGSYFEMEKEFVRLSREHRCFFHNLGYKHSGKVVDSFAPELEGEGKNIRVKSWERFDRHFGPYLDGSAFSGSKRGEYPLEFMYLPFNLHWPASYEKWGQKGYRTEYRRIIADFVRHFEEKGWKKTFFEIMLNHKKDYRFFPYTVDEIWYEHDEEALDAFYDVIKDTYDTTEVKFVFRVDDSNHYGNHFNSKYTDICKMWVVGADFFSWFPESVPVIQDKNLILWIYGPVLRSMDESLLTLFTWPVRCFMSGIGGFTVWNATGFGKDYLNTPHDNGTEALMYPGVEFGYNGPLPSIRLKALRNYMQTADLMMLTRGTEDESIPVKREVEKIVNGYFALEGKDCWFREKPDYIHEPPRYWDFDKKVPETCFQSPHCGKTPCIIEKINSDLLKLLGGKHA
jgi:hypothetical protein